MSWNGCIAQVLGGPEDARDIYVRQTRLHELMGRPDFHVRFLQGAMDVVPTEDALASP